MFSFICAWINGWVNKGEAGDLGRQGNEWMASWNLAISGSDNSLAPVRCQAPTRSNACMLFEPLEKSHWNLNQNTTSIWQISICACRLQNGSHLIHAPLCEGLDLSDKMPGPKGKHPESGGARREITCWHQAEESGAEGGGFRRLMPASDLPTRTTRRAGVFLSYRTYLWHKQQVMSINLTTWSAMQCHVVWITYFSTWYTVNYMYVINAYSQCVRGGGGGGGGGGI